VLKQIARKVLGEEVVMFYEGIHGEHLFLNGIHQWVNRQRGKWRPQSPNNVGLPGNLIEQVRIAYSVPRLISIITVRDGTTMNMFPTDLHGALGEKFYAGSLRLGGSANAQIDKYNQVAISEVEPSFYKQAYLLGKNHMRELQSESGFPLARTRTKHLNFPLPAAAVSYRELKKIDSLDIGIHRIHLYEIIHRQVLLQDKPFLSHIHQYYAQWRLDRNLPTPMLLR
jgi:flavin reductase (DIM6/NTAB) family NADH-FMN oxidoreductase RutF